MVVVLFSGLRDCLCNFACMFQFCNKCTPYIQLSCREGAATSDGCNAGWDPYELAHDATAIAASPCKIGCKKGLSFIYLCAHLRLAATSGGPSDPLWLITQWPRMRHVGKYTYRSVYYWGSITYQDLPVFHWFFSWKISTVVIVTRCSTLHSRGASDSFFSSFFLLQVCTVRTFIEYRY